jgi:hypothetical protein
VEESEASATTPSPSTSRTAPTVDVGLSMSDLELIERGLKTLAYVPGYDYHQAPRIRTLVDRLERAVQRLEAAATHRAVYGWCDFGIIARGTER